MPEISRFLGIIIAMLYNDHNPPHFHAYYGEYKIKAEIYTGIVDGIFSKRALKAVLEWYEIYKDLLIENWDIASKHKVLKKIPPLE